MNDAVTLLGFLFLSCLCSQSHLLYPLDWRANFATEKVQNRVRKDGCGFKRGFYEEKRWLQSRFPSSLVVTLLLPKHKEIHGSFSLKNEKWTTNTHNNAVKESVCHIQDKRGIMAKHFNEKTTGVAFSLFLHPSLLLFQEDSLVKENVRFHARWRRYCVCVSDVCHASVC